MATFTVTDSSAVTAVPTIVKAYTIKPTADSSAVTATPTVEVINLIYIGNPSGGPSDSTSVSDASTLTVSTPKISVTDSSAVSGTPNIQTVDNINKIDSSAISESIQISLVNVINIIESTTVSDTLIVNERSFISVLDQTPMSELYAIGNPIVFDNSGSFSSILNSVSGGFVTAGNNRAMVAFVYSASALFDIVAPTYNGFVMENVAKIALPSGYPGFLAAYYLPNPSLGSNTFSVTRTGTSTVFVASVMSYDNVSPDSIIDNFAFSSVLLASSITEILTSDTPGEWSFLGVVSGLSATLTAGAGTKLRTNSSPLWSFDSNGPVGDAGTTYSMTANSSSSVDGLVAVMFDLEPYIWFESQPVILGGDDIFVLDNAILLVSTPQIFVTDSTQITDSMTPEVLNFVNVIDNTITSDNPALSVSVPRISIIDSSTVSDFPSLSLISYISVLDSSVVSDKADLSLTSYLGVLDISIVSDSITTEEIDQGLVVSDSTAILDTANLNLLSLVNISDSSAVSDSVLVSETLSIVVSDSTQIIESQTVTVSSPQVSVEDDTLIFDTSQVFVPILIIQVVSVVTALDSTNIRILGTKSKGYSFVVIID